MRRDLQLLEELGLVVRVHGGVLHPRSVLGEATFETRDTVAREQKKAIADAVADLVPANAVLFIDGGTTCLEAARRLVGRRDLTIYTNSLPVAALGAGTGARVACIGGEVKAVSRALVGALALEWLDNIRFDAGLFGASGLSDREGASTTAADEAAVKMKAIERTREPVLLADSTKWEVPCTVRFAPWSGFHTVVSDRGLPKAARARIAEAGPRVVVARREAGR